jgi:hypothetical protein
MRVWHTKCYFLQGLSHISENIRSRQKSAFSLPIPKHLDLENLVCYRHTRKTEWQNRGGGKHLRFPSWRLFNICFFFFLIPFGYTGIWTQGFGLASRSNTTWAMPPSPLCSGCFGDGLSFLPRLAWNSDPPYLSFLCTLGWQKCATHLTVCWGGFLLTPNWDPPDVSLPSS